MAQQSLASVFRVLDNSVAGPRDWYRIEHCETEKNQSYYSIRINVWRDGRFVRYESEGANLIQAIAIALNGIALKLNPAQGKQSGS